VDAERRAGALTSQSGRYIDRDLMLARRHSGGCSAGDTVVGADHNAGADFGHDGSCDSIANSSGLYQIPTQSGSDRVPEGDVKARGGGCARIGCRSSRERGVSVASGVMSFELRGSPSTCSTPGFRPKGFEGTSTGL
jgi:hypothetical protein